MTYLLDSLAGRGRPGRAPPGPGRPPARRIVATVRGRALLDGLGERLREAEDQVLAGLNEAEDRPAFRALLQRLALHAADRPGRHHPGPLHHRLLTPGSPPWTLAPRSPTPETD